MINAQTIIVPGAISEKAALIIGQVRAVERALQGFAQPEQLATVPGFIDDAIARLADLKSATETLLHTNLQAPKAAPSETTHDAF